MIKKISAITILLFFLGCSGTSKIPETKELKTWQDTVSYSLGADIGNTFKLRGINVESTSFSNGFLGTIDGDSSYALGASLASNLIMQDIEINSEIFLNAFDNSIKDDSLIFTDSDIRDIVKKYNQQLRDEANAKQQEKLDKNLNDGEAFIKEYKNKHTNEIETESGLVYRVVQEGFGDMPTLDDRVIVQYIGKLIDGTIFDSSFERGEPTTFSLKGIIKGWQEALTMMKVGSKWELVIPPGIGYGERSTGAIPGNSTLIFEVELLGIE